MINLNLKHNPPLFGLDIGHSSLKVMQISQPEKKSQKPKVLGYGSSYRYDVSSIINGEIVDFKAIGTAMRDLFDQKLSGTISTRHVACTIPMAHSFSQPLKLPLVEDDALPEAVALEAERYIPVAADKLYMDYEIIRRDEKNIELLVVATPKKIIESYMKFFGSMGLEPVALEPTMNATARIFGFADPAHAAPTVLIDFGANAIDIAIYDKTLFISSTVQGGSNTMIEAISKRLGIDRDEAYNLKTSEGLTLKGHARDISSAVQPTLTNLVHEIRKIMRYYSERVTAGSSRITQTITTGGGANMPGLSDYLSNELSVPVRQLDPWAKIDFGELIPPNELERSMFITVAGEAILNPAGVYDD